MTTLGILGLLIGIDLEPCRTTSPVRTLFTSIGVSRLPVGATVLTLPFLDILLTGGGLLAPFSRII